MRVKNEEEERRKNQATGSLHSHIKHSNPKALKKLKIAAQKAKHTLSQALDAEIDIDSLFEGEDLFCPVTRAEFENLCSPLIEVCSFIRLGHFSLLKKTRGKGMRVKKKE